MKIFLVNTNTEIAPYPVSPLGLCMVSSALKKEGYEVKIFDGLWDLNDDSNRLNRDQLTKELNSFKPQVIGVSIRNIDDVVMENTTYYIDDIEHLFIKPIQEYGKAITVLGGSGYSLFPNELLIRWKFDYGITGPGEESFLSLIESIENKKINNQLQGVLSRNNENRITVTRRKKLPDKQIKLVLPDARIDHQLNFKPYLSRSSYPIQTKRGCALKCLYCSYPTLEGTSYQLRTASDVVNEIEAVAKRLPETVFEFVDSTFNHPPQHAENICREIINRRLSLRLRTMGVNPSGVTPELIDLMRKAGFAQIDCTPDSASDKMLKNLKKGFTRKKLEEVVGLLKNADMPTMWFFVLGGPGEDENTLEETFGFIDRFIDERDLVHLTEGLRIYPETGLEQIALEEGMIKNGESLLSPRFYVSPKLGHKKLKKRVEAFVEQHYNCLRSVDSSPSKEMIKKALDLRKREKLTDEPMFRTLLRIRKEDFSV